MDALRRGGSLVDAMIGASAMLAVVLPHATSLGGCAMMLAWDAKTRTLSALDGSGTAPMAACPALFAGGPIDARGPRSWLVPGLVAFWAKAHARFGKLPWDTLFGDAIAAANDGVGLASELARNLALAQADLRRQPGFAHAYLNHGRDPAAGERYRASALGSTIARIAAEGADAFYRGRIARDLVEFSQTHGGLLTATDLASFDAQWVEPVRQRFGGREVAVMPPKSVGVLMLAQLDALQRSAAAPHATLSETLTRQIRVARDTLGALRDRVADAGAQWPYVASTQTYPSEPDMSQISEPGDTAGIVLADHDGNALVMLQSVFQPFGSGCVDAATGIAMNNRLQEFGLDPAKHNVLAPGKRPVHTLNPFMVIRDGAVELCAASPGGVSQTTTGVQLLTNVLDFSAPLPEAIDAPRWSLSRAGELMCEPGFPVDVIDALAAQGVAVLRDSLHPFYFGSLKAIRWHGDGILEAAADLRREASALFA